jgi:hypothetical protein
LDTLVAAVEETPDGIQRVIHGDAWTKERLRDAMAFHFGFVGTELGPEIGQRIPETVLTTIAEHIREATSRVSRQFSFLGHEDRATGALFGSTLLDVDQDGWKVRIWHQGFSPQIKEPESGADGGIIVDVQDRQGNRVIKAAWFQAKRSASQIVDPLVLPGLASQVGLMQERTREAYAVVYTPERVEVYRQGDREHATTLDALVVGMMRCTSGDRNRDLLPDTLDKTLILGVLATEVR